MSTLQFYGLIAAIASAVIAGAFGLIRLAVGDVKKQATQLGRDEVIQEVQRADNEATRRADTVLAERRSVDGTIDRLSDHRF